MVAVPSTITLGTLIAAVRRQFGDLDAVQISDVDITDWANQGQRQIYSEHTVGEAKATAVSIVGTAEYNALPNDLYEITDVHFNNYPLRKMNFSEAQEQYAQYFTSTGNPDIWFMYDNVLHVYPSPNAVKNITIYYRRAPVKVTNAGDFLGVPDRYFNALLQFVLARAYEMDEQPELLAAQETLFAQSSQKLSNKENVRGGAPWVVGDRAYEDGAAYYEW